MMDKSTYPLKRADNNQSTNVAWRLIRRPALQAVSFFFRFL
jgi:hypothetical protein